MYIYPDWSQEINHPMDQNPYWAHAVDFQESGQLSWHFFSNLPPSGKPRFLWGWRLSGSMGHWVKSSKLWVNWVLGICMYRWVTSWPRLFAVKKGDYMYVLNEYTIYIDICTTKFYRIYRVCFIICYYKDHIWIHIHQPVQWNAIRVLNVACICIYAIYTVHIFQLVHRLSSIIYHESDI